MPDPPWHTTRAASASTSCCGTHASTCVLAATGPSACDVDVAADGDEDAGVELGDGVEGGPEHRPDDGQRAGDAAERDVDERSAPPRPPVGQRAARRRRRLAVAPRVGVRRRVEQGREAGEVRRREQGRDDVVAVRGEGRRDELGGAGLDRRLRDADLEVRDAGAQGGDRRRVLARLAQHDVRSPGRRRRRSIAGSIAAVLSRPKISRLAITAASAGGASPNRAHSGSSSSAGGRAPRRYGWPVACAVASSSGGTTSSTSSPRSASAATNGSSGRAWPAPGPEATRTRIRPCRAPARR